MEKFAVFELNSNTEKDDQEKIYITKDIDTVYDAEKRLEKLQETFYSNRSLIQNVEVIEEFNVLKKLINKEKNLTEVETNYLKKCHSENYAVCESDSTIETDDEEDLYDTEDEDFDKSSPNDFDKNLFLKQFHLNL